MRGHAPRARGVSAVRAGYFSTWAGSKMRGHDEFGGGTMRSDRRKGVSTVHEEGPSVVAVQRMGETWTKEMNECMTPRRGPWAADGCACAAETRCVTKVDTQVRARECGPGVDTRAQAWA